MTRVRQVSISSTIIMLNKTAVLFAITDIALCQNMATMSGSAALEMMDGSGTVDRLSEGDVSRLHKQGLRNMCGVQKDFRVC